MFIINYNFTELFSKIVQTRLNFDDPAPGSARGLPDVAEIAEERSLLDVAITNVVVAAENSGGRSHIEFKIVVKFVPDQDDSNQESAASWSVKCRYSQFNELDQTIQKMFAMGNYPGLQARLPALPGKELFATRDERFLENRRQGLNAYIQQISKMPEMYIPDLLEFLAVPENIRSRLERIQESAIETLRRGVALQSSNAGFAHPAHAFHVEAEDSASDGRSSDRNFGSHPAHAFLSMNAEEVEHVAAVSSGICVRIPTHRMVTPDAQAASGLPTRQLERSASLEVAGAGAVESHAEEGTFFVLVCGSKVELFFFFCPTPGALRKIRKFERSSLIRSRESPSPVFQRGVSGLRRQNHSYF